MRQNTTVELKDKVITQLHTINRLPIKKFVFVLKNTLTVSQWAELRI